MCKKKLPVLVVGYKPSKRYIWRICPVLKKGLNILNALGPRFEKKKKYDVNSNFLVAMI